MKLNKVIYVLAATLLLGACSSKNKNKINYNVIKETEFDSKGNLNYVVDYRYDIDGRLLEEVETYYEDGKEDISMTRLYYSGNLLITTENSDYDNDNRTWNPTDFYTSYSYDILGNRSTISSYKDNGDEFVLQYIYTFTYDSNNNQIKEIMYSYDKETSDLYIFISHEKEYTEDNKLVQEIMYTDWERDGILDKSLTKKYTYNEEGKLIRQEDIDRNNMVYGFTSYQYKDNETIETYSSIEDDGQAKLKIQTFKYVDSYNRLTREEYFVFDTETNTFVLDTFTNYEYEDLKDNPVNSKKYVPYHG